MIGLGVIEIIILGLVCLMGVIVPIVIAVVLVAGNSRSDGRDEQK